MKTAIFVSMVVICAGASLFNAYSKSGKRFTLAIRRNKNMEVQDGIVK